MELPKRRILSRDNGESAESFSFVSILREKLEFVGVDLA